MEKKWTVFLLYPDYATGDYGADIFVDWAECKDPFEAVEVVKKKASEANTADHDAGIPAEDFRPIAVLEGHHSLELDATCF